MTPGLVFLLILVGAYLAAHVASEWLARRHLIVSGAEYLLLGILMGPQFAGVIRPDAVDGFAPFLTLAFGWIGALIGAQFFLPELLRIPGRYFRVAFGEALTALAAIAGLVLLALRWQLGLPLGEATVAAIALGAIGTASAPAGIALATREVGGQTPLLRQLQVATAVDALVAVVAFGLLLAIVHQAPPAAGRVLTPTEWVALSLAIGIGGGALFHLFLGPERQIDRLFIALTGALILASGAAGHLRLSPLLPAMLIGVVLVNTSHSRDSIRLVLGKVERPLYFVLLTFAGAAWEPGTRGWVIPVVAFLVIRWVAKVGAARLAARLSDTLPELGPRWGRGLLGHGGLAVAIGLNYRLHPDAVLPDVVFTATIVSLLITDLFSARLVRGLAAGYAERMRRAAGLGGGGGGGGGEGEAAGGRTGEVGP